MGINSHRGNPVETYPRRRSPNTFRANDAKRDLRKRNGPNGAVATGHGAARRQKTSKSGFDAHQTTVTEHDW